MVIKLTVNERILLHLRRFYTVQKEVEAPQAVTQKGIADAIDIRVTHVPRSVKKLEEEGLIYESVMHIKGLDKRRKAYFLTEKGMFSANELKRNLGERKVTYRDDKGNVKETRIADIEDNTGLRLPFLELINLLDRERVISYKSMELLAKYQDKGMSSGETTLFDLPHKIPVTGTFYDRKQELSSLMSWIADDDIKMVSIVGARGMGKSTLVGHVMNELRGGENVYWYDSARGEGFDDILESLGDFLARLNKNELKTALRSRERGHRDILKALNSGLLGIKTILVFDTLDSADDQVRKFISGISREIENLPDVTIVLVGSIAGDLIAKETIGSRHLKDMKLAGLDRDSCKALLGVKKLDKREFERIYKLTEGNPQALLLIRSEDISELKKSGRYTADELTLIKYLKTLDRI